MNERINPMVRENYGPFKRKGVDAYVKRMSKPQSKPIYDSTTTAILEKAGYEIPEDPASIYDPEQLWLAYDKYTERSVYSEDEYVGMAIGRAFKAFGYRESRSKLIPLQTETEIMEAIKLEKHAGVYFDTKLVAWPRAWTRREDVVYNRKKPNPCLAGVRTQRGNKTRLVWMYPLEMTMLEASFARPLIDVFKEIRSPMPYALRRHEIGARLEFTLTERNKVALDFSKFDSSVPKELILVAFKILKTWFHELEDFDEESWNKVVKYFIYTPLVMIDGNLYKGKKKGVPSGSYFTQLVDSIVNYIIITASMIKFDFHHNERTLHILGDDSVFSTNTDVNLKLLKLYFETLGFKLNVEKSEVRHKSESIHFIGFDWIRATPHRDLNKAILSASQPEKFRSKGKDFQTEQERAYQLILETVSLGVNLYEVLKAVRDGSTRAHLYIQSSDKGQTGYTKFVAAEMPKPYWRNVATGIWI